MSELASPAEFLKSVDEKNAFEKQQAELAEKHKEFLKKYSVDSKGRIHFKNDEIYLPTTYAQLDSLVNEILTAMNCLTQPMYLTADYMLQVVTSALHGLKEYDHGVVKKSYLFRACVKKVAMHVSYDATKSVQDRIKNQATAKGEVVQTFTDGMNDESDEAPQELEPDAPSQAPSEASSV
jgi:hypothetical protein